MDDTRKPSTGQTKSRIARAPGGSACTACRTKKRRCDGARPGCDRCSRVGVTCVYPPSKLQQKMALLQQALETLETDVGLLESAPRGSGATGTAGPVGLRVVPPVRWQPARGNAALALLIPPPDFPIPSLLSIPGNEISYDRGSWCQTGEPPPLGLSNLLVSTFLRHEAVFAYDLKSHDFFKMLHGPDAPGTPHPALRNAIFLVGCHFCGEPVASILEPVFLKRTRESLHHSLANVDRIVDFIEASTLLSGYQYLKGRFVEALHTNSTTIRFAAACGLNSLRPPYWGRDNSNSILGPPEDEHDLRRRVNIWWMLFRINRAGSSAAHLPNALPDEKIVTVWEVELLGAQRDDTTISSLYDPESSATYVLHDAIKVLRSKSLALLDRSSRLGPVAGTADRDDEEFWSKFRATDRAVLDFLESLPPLHGTQHQVSTKPISRDPALVVPYTLGYNATIILHNGLAEEGNAASYDKCLNAAYGAMKIVHHVLGEGICSDAFVYATVCWANVFQVLAREFDRACSGRPGEKCDFLKAEMNTLLHGLQLFSWKSSVAGEYARRLRAQVPDLG